MLNEVNAKFILTCIEQTSKNKASYGNLFNSNRLLKGKVKLPLDQSRNINWSFMEECIKEREHEKRQKLKAYYKNKLLDLAIIFENLTDVEWKAFPLEALFKLERGNQNNMSICVEGDIPLISAKKVDNGLKDFISNNGKKMFSSHILTLNNDGDGGVGIAYYQANKTAIDTHVTALIPKFSICREAMLYISKIITAQRHKFSHGYSLNNNRIKRQKIMLPVTDGEINYEYMEYFIKNIEKRQIESVLQYLDNIESDSFT